MDWIRSGKAFIGIHSASDTFHQWPEFIEMLGGEFRSHGAHLPRVFALALEEIYLFKNYDAGRVNELLVLDKHPNDRTPGSYPMAWTRDYGKGRVFYTALGHRKDLWDTDPLLKDRKNPVAAAEAFRAHILGGILWAIRSDEEKLTK